MALNPFRTMRGRLTTATAVVVGLVTIAAAATLYTVARSSLIGDVRQTLTENLIEARGVLNRAVATELNLLSLGVATDPLDQTRQIVEQECSQILETAYGNRALPFDDFYYQVSVDPITFAQYNDCLFFTDPFVDATVACADTVIAALGNPVVTFEEFERIYYGPEFDQAYDACVQESVLVDAEIDAAAAVCDDALFSAFDDIDVLDENAVAQQTEAALGDYVACMRTNGVPAYPDISASTEEDGSVLSAVAGSAVVIPALDSVRASVDRFGLGLVIGVPTLVVVLGVLAWIVVGRALAPVEAIRSRVSAITADDLHRRVPDPGTRDEVARLASTMNEMLDRLERSAERQRQFVSDASHELRSPLASIRTQLEVALAHPEADRWTDVGEGVLAEGLRMERLVSDLLVLARADEGVVVTATAEVDLTDIVLEEAARITEPTVNTAGVTAVRVTGDSLGLRRAVRNLLENAARHSEEEVAVSMALEPGGDVAVHVDDDGEGIDPSDRHRVFERFTRLEAGRTRDAGGAGLGLAVVHEIAQAHNGSVSVADSALGGARFTIRLPAGPNP